MERPLIFGILIVFLMAVTASIIEYFVPLSVRFEMNSECRRALLLAEQKGELNSTDKAELKTDLEHTGFKNVSVLITGGTVQGSRITLRVEADYEYSRLVGVLTRHLVTQKAIYEKTTTIRRVVN